MEMNTRLQVEHPVTEAVTGEDLVSWQFKVAAGEPLPLDQDTIAQRIRERGWAFEARIYAENPSQHFMPDSGKLIHLKTPQISDDVRIDAGFIQGDTVSSAYDGMIAKLIVSGPTREVAIRKMHAALEEYEIVGLSTNIEFLKRVCQSPAFIKGDVETGYIQKYHDELFAEESIVIEAYAQAALGLFAKDVLNQNGLSGFGPHGSSLGFSSNERLFQFHPSPANTDSPTITVTVGQTGSNIFSIAISGGSISETYSNIVSETSPASNSITTYFPHTRLQTTLICSTTSNSLENVTLFQRGKQIQLTLATPAWFEQALGIKDVTNSVLAPMPCKVLRNEVSEGDKVEKDQALVVIESMKMETVIRSPQKGVVKKLVHKEGDICKAGTVLVLFEEGDAEK
jgi:3-methylcrotonyl-CoA carboxylase alpha subunit